LLADQINWLKQAGFSDVDVVYKNFFLGVFLAIKGGISSFGSVSDTTRKGIKNHKDTDNQPWKKINCQHIAQNYLKGTDRQPISI
jgi:hypothetical protein